jgi:hypothetical protein
LERLIDRCHPQNDWIGMYLKRCLETVSPYDTMMCICIKPTIPPFIYERDIHVVAFVHAVLATYYAVQLLRDPVLQADKLWGYTKESGNIYAAIVGYRRHHHHMIMHG